MSVTLPVRRGGEVASSSGEDASTGEIPVVPASDPGEGSARGPGGGEVLGRPGLVVVGAAVTILAAMLLGFVAELTFVGSLQNSRDQQVLFDQFRKELAEGKVPVGQSVDGALVAPGTPVALLRIPAIGVDEVVVEGTTSTQTVSGPGHVRNTVLPGQGGTSVLMGRQAAYGGPFARLAELAPGNAIEVTTGQGIQTFTVTGVRGDGDRGPAALVAGKGRLTLITADGPSYAPTGTLWVDATLTSPTQPAATLAASVLPASEKPMSGDPAAWIPLVFWAQALVLAALGVVWAAARWGRWQAWLVGVPVLAFLGLSVAGQLARLLPNLL